ncbi:MAG: ATP-binding protein, partial [Propionibacteriaceae bacterium]|nr:ATP-binding protein [Propionibacteriaceae bacterium]
MTVIRELLGSISFADTADPPDFVGREAELAELAEFCRGRAAYRLWVGDPYAGKSALLAHFLMRGDDSDTVMVGFFIKRTDQRRNSADGFLRSLSRQLCLLLGERDTSGASFLELQHELPGLLVKASEHATASGQTLLLVIDALDEEIYQSKGPEETPSIAELLPCPTPAG